MSGVCLLFQLSRICDYKTRPPILPHILTDEECQQWNDRVLNGTPNNEQAQQRFTGLVEEVAQSRAISIDQLPKLSTWVDVIECDEGRI